MSRPFHIGVALVVLYAALAVGYVAFGGRVRPLFDGFAPPPPYRWVNPPREFAAGNDPPGPSTFDVALGPAGSVQGGGSSEDGQAIFSFAAGAFPAHPPDTKVTVQVTPLDPSTLAAPPPGVAADGNAYRVDFAYQPSSQAVPLLAVPADVFLVVPEPAQTLLFSTDGQSWDSLPLRPVPDPTQIGGRFDRPGYLLAVAPPVTRATDLSGTSDSSRLLGAAGAVFGLTALLILLPVGWRTIRRKQDAP